MFDELHIRKTDGSFTLEGRDRAWLQDGDSVSELLQVAKEFGEARNVHTVIVHFDAL